MKKTKLEGAAHQVLEALENLYLTLSPESVLAISLNRRITALREALLESEQEPVGWLGKDSQKFIKNVGQKNVKGQPLYIVPPARKPLTEEEIAKMWREATIKPAWTSEMVLAFARAIEAAHNIKD